MCDSLQYLPIERWNELEKVFEADWPRGVAALTALKTQRDLESAGLGYGFKVFCPFGEPANGMVALNKKGELNKLIIQCPTDDTSQLKESLIHTSLIDWNITYLIPYMPENIVECGELNELIIQCPTDDTSQLKESLIHTSLIDWNITYLIPYMPENIVECVSELAKQVNVEMEAEDTVPNQLFLLSKEKAQFELDSLPAEITFRPITRKYLQTIDATWRNRYNGSLWLFTMLSQANFGYGVFKDEELISWVFNNEVGALTHLYTIDKYRGKGYAESLMKRFCNLCLKERKNVFAYSRKGNTGACKLYNKLGFEMFHEVRWCYLKPKGAKH